MHVAPFLREARILIAIARKFMPVPLRHVAGNSEANLREIFIVKLPSSARG
jgi:hypothetical protein